MLAFATMSAAIAGKCLRNRDAGSAAAAAARCEVNCKNDRREEHPRRNRKKAIEKRGEVHYFFVRFLE